MTPQQEKKLDDFHDAVIRENYNPQKKRNLGMITKATPAYAFLITKNVC